MEELTDNEKAVIRIALEKHLEEVQKQEHMANQDLVKLAAEEDYEGFVKGIIAKLR